MKYEVYGKGKQNMRHFEIRNTKAAVHTSFRFNR